MRAERRSRVVVAAIVLGAVLFVAGCHTVFGPRPIDERWNVHDGPRVSFFVRPGSFAEQNVGRLIEVLEDQYSATVSALRLTYAGRVRGFAFDSAADANLSSDYSGRAFPDTEAFRFVCVPPVGDNLFGLMSHEANHVLIIAGLGHARTYFMTEGLATAVLSERFHATGRHFLFPWTKAHRSVIPALSALLDDDGWSRAPEQDAYRASASFLAWLLDTYGPDRLRQVYAASSSEIVDRIRAVYSRPLETLEADWLRFCDTWVG